MFIITSNNKTPQSLMSHSGLHLLWHRNNGGQLLQLTQGGSKVKRQCQSTIVEEALVRLTIHRQEAENGLI